MTPELAICERLAATPAVTAIVADRIYDIALPQESELAAIRVLLVGHPKIHHLRGGLTLSRASVQVDACVPERAVSEDDDPGANLEALTAAIDASLDGQAFSVGNPVSMKVTGVFQENRQKVRLPDEQRYLRVSLDYVVWSKTVS